MARKLKTYQTSIGFFDLGIAAPSRKAALEAWGANSNVFHQGVAKESSDPKVIAAAMSKPGVIFRRPVGSNAAFKEHARLPTDLPRNKAIVTPTTRTPKSKRLSSRTKVDDKAARKAALAFEREQQRRESERRKEEAARAKKRQQRQQAMAKAEAALAKAEREHERRASAIEVERAALEKRSQAEEGRWGKQSDRLKKALRQAQDK